MAENKCGRRLTCDPGNKCRAADLKLQKAAAACLVLLGVLERMSGVAGTCYFWGFFADKFPPIDKHLLTDMSKNKGRWRDSRKRGKPIDNGTFSKKTDQNSAENKPVDPALACCICNPTVLLRSQKPTQTTCFAVT